MNTLEQFPITDKMKDNGLLAIYAHADDDLITIAAREFLREHGVQLTFLALTDGRFGIPGHMKDLGVTPQKMVDIRKEEFTAMGNALGIQTIMLGYKDLSLEDLRFSHIRSKVLQIYRKGGYGGILSIHPEEYSRNLDHPDHTIAGRVARSVGAASNVSYYYPRFTVKHEFRPTLLMWTTDQSKAKTSLPLTRRLRKLRLDNFLEFYPSQITRKDLKQTGIIFDRNSRQQGKSGYVELYDIMRD